MLAFRKRFSWFKSLRVREVCTIFFHSQKEITRILQAFQNFSANSGFIVKSDRSINPSIIIKEGGTDHSRICKVRKSIGRSFIFFYRVNNKLNFYIFSRGLNTITKFSFTKIAVFRIPSTFVVSFIIETLIRARKCSKISFFSLSFLWESRKFRWNRGKRETKFRFSNNQGKGNLRDNCVCLIIWKMVRTFSLFWI